MNKNRFMSVAVGLCLVLLVGAVASHAGEKKISRKQLPAPVLKAFESAYPKATIKGQAVETEKGVKYYEIESVDGQTNRDLLYTADGKVAEIEETMDLGSLPEVMKNALDKKYPHGKLVRAEKVTRDTSVTYEVQLKVGKKVHGVSLDASGNILKAGAEGEEKEENEENENEK
jgi:hypothetical protein